MKLWLLGLFCVAGLGCSSVAAPLPSYAFLLDQNCEACCKTCRKGKACGDSCISRKKDCNEGPGCACDAE